MDSAFTAKFKFFINKKRKSGKDPDRYLIIDWTPEEARKASKWLIDQADAAEMPGGSTIRKKAPQKEGFLFFQCDLRRSFFMVNQSFS